MTDYFRYRLYEIFPGALVWSVLLGGLALSFVRPLWVIYFMIVFSVYWVTRVLYFSIFLLYGWSRFRRAQRVDWMEKVRMLTGHSRVFHLIFLPMYDEDVAVVRATLQTLAQASYPSKFMIVVLAGEERRREHFERVARQVSAEFSGVFFKLWTTLHPMNTPGEISGKGSNLHYAACTVVPRIDELGLDYRRVIVSAFDIDTIAHRHYFAYLTHEYLTHEDPTHTSFQPVALYNNNMWESPSILRIMSFGTTFWLLFALGRPDTITTFSSHSMSLKALIDVGFWQRDVVSEDSRIFLQSFIHYGGRYRVHPLYIPVSMDTARDEKWVSSIKNLYKQQRRWAWGVEHIPYLLWQFHTQRGRIPFLMRVKQLWYQIEGKFSWGTTALILLVFGRLPLWVAGEEVTKTVLFQNTPHILEWLMGFAMLGLLISMALSLTLLPPPPASSARHTILMMVLQWALLPVSLLVVSAVPAIDAQTHLMLGRYLGFNVSKKKRAAHT